MLKNWCSWTVLLEKTLESPLDCNKIKPVNPKGSQPWIFTGKTDAKSWHYNTLDTDEKSRHFRKGPDTGKDWRQEEKGMKEDEMVVWHHWFYGPESERAPEENDGQGSLECCSPWGHKESDMIEQLNHKKKWKCMLCSSVGRINSVKMYMLHKLYLRCNPIPIKITITFFSKLKWINPEIYMEFHLSSLKS